MEWRGYIRKLRGETFATVVPNKCVFLKPFPIQENLKEKALGIQM